MALILNLKYLDGLEGKGERLVKVKFRDYVKTSNTVRGKDSVYFGEQLEWPVGRKLDVTDVLEIRVFNYSKYLQNRLVGSLTMSLQELLNKSSLTMREHLIDTNNAMMKTMITFEVNYYSPDSMIGDWRKEEFSYPVLDLPRRRERTATEGDAEDEQGGDGDALSQISFSDTRSLLAADQMKDYLTFQNDDALSAYSDGGDSAHSQNVKRNLGVPAVLDPTMHKCEDYQVSLTIVEARQLSGPNINPCIEVRVGDRCKKTEIQMSTNSPYYNQYFCFDFHMSKAELFDQVVRIRALAMGTMMISRLLPGDLIGEFRMDVRTVYMAPDHMFFHKWAMLVDPKDILGGAKGYVKCDISVIGKGEQVKFKAKSQTKKSKSNEEEDIEANLLLPTGVPIKRQMAEISVKLYRAEDLPKMNTDIMASIKQAFTGDAKPLADPYVNVSFAGHSEKTKTKKNSYAPEWNEEIVFTEMFPPLCNRIRISVYDWDAVYNECIATHFIELNQIMNDGENGFLPTFGPSWVNLYGMPRNYTYEQMLHPREELNRGLGEGVAYRGRLLMAIKTELKQDSAGCSVGARASSTHPVSEAFVAGKKEDFILVGVIYEAGVIDAEIGKKGKPVFFELSIGTVGNHLDGRFVDEEDDDIPPPGPNTPKTKIEPSTPSYLIWQTKDGPKPLPMWCHSITTPTVPVTKDKEYYHIPYNDKKPCLYMRCQYEDHRPRMYIPNILERLLVKFERSVEEIQDLHSRRKRAAPKKLRHLLDEFFDCVEQCSSTIRSCRGTAGKTLLDKERTKHLRIQLEKMKVKVRNMKKDLNEKNTKERVRECRALVRLLREMATEPQHALPDVFIWMIQEDKRQAFARIPARQILHSIVDDERGKDCSTVMTVFLRKPGRKGMGQSGWTLQGQLKMYLWLGLLKEMRHYRKEIPPGYAEDTFKYKRPPNEIIYTEKSYFQLRCHMFMARNLIGSDETGLSDAFARIIINDCVITTKVINETLSPKWDETLVVEKMIFYLSEEVLKDHPPVVVVEVFDEDTVLVGNVGVMGNQTGKSEFLGRCFVKPAVTLIEEEYKTPRLEWWEIYRGQLNAGELLAAFELIQLHADNGFRVPEQVPDLFDIRPSDFEEDPSRGPLVFPVPLEIRPSLCSYRVEILFWGVRELQRIQLMAVDQPKVTAEFGGFHIESEMIPSAKAKPNFPKAVKFLDIKLPENELYWPPMMFQAEDMRNFGRKVLVGNHVLSTVTDYIVRPELDLAAWCRPIDDDQQSEAAGSTTGGAKKSSLGGPPGMLGAAKGFARKSNNLANGDRSSIAGSLAALPPVNVRQPGSAAVSRRSSVQSRISNRLGGGGGSGGGGRAGSVVQGGEEGGHAEVHASPGDVYLQMQERPHSRAGSQAGSVPPNAPSVMVNGAPGSSPETSPAHGAADTQPLVTPGSPAIVPTTGTTPGAGDDAKPGGIADLKKKPKIPKEELEDVDWWSRFYASIDDLEEQEDVEDDSDSDIDVLKDINVDVKSEAGDKDDVVDIPSGDEDDPKGKKKKKKKKKKKEKKRKKRKVGLPFKKDPRKEFQSEKDDDLVYESGVQEDNSWIERIKIYQSPLEDVKEYGGFQAFIRTYPLYRGKQEDDDEPSDNRIVGTFKGNLAIYKIPDEDFGKDSKDVELKLYKDIPKNEPVSVLVRVYIIRANDLHPADPNGKSDPYLIVRLGGTTVNDKENYIPKQLNPVFGKCFEIDAKIPQESMLHISIMDWDLVSGDDLIGETRIDLENRFYSKHRATCGVAKTYENHGYNKWRDIQTPTSILAKLCTEAKLDPPKYEPMFNKVSCGGKAFYANVEVEDDGGEVKQSNEPLALEVLHHWDDVSPLGQKLVPEHVETRPLFSPEKPGIEQGRLEMWVDMFPKELGAPPVPVDITPRVPKSYELRVVIWNTDEVVLNDDGMLTGEKSSDIFVKGWMKGLGIDDQVTDVHYRSLSGEGNFNWRFIFNFDYLKAEDKIIYKVKDSPFAIDETEVKSPCKLYVQVWDADIVSADDFLGGVELSLSKMPRGAKSAKSCGLHQLSKDGSVPTMSVFRNKRARGWWPMVADSEEEPGEQEVTGKVDAEIQLLTAEEGEQDPAGLARADPQGLPPPNRPETSFLSFMNPLKAIKYLICNVCFWLLIKLLIIGALVALLVLFIYSSPGYISKKIIGA